MVLSCSGQANPSPHMYSWYKRSGLDSVLKMVDKEVNLTLNLGDEGLYHCEAHNEVGSQNSSAIEVHFAGKFFPYFFLYSIYLKMASFFRNIRCSIMGLLSPNF